MGAAPGTPALPASWAEGRRSSDDIGDPTLHLPEIHHAGNKQFNHPDVGLVDLVYHSMDVSADGSRTLVMTVYTAEPGTDSEDRLRLLASWAATHATA